jgi:hypothetical protein
MLKSNLSRFENLGGEIPICLARRQVRRLMSISYIFECFLKTARLRSSLMVIIKISKHLRNDAKKYCGFSDPPRCQYF